MKTPKRAKPRIWLARKNLRCMWQCSPDTNYAIAVGRPLIRESMREGVYWWDHNLEVCPELWELASGVRLKPGAGPVEIEVKITRKKEARR